MQEYERKFEQLSEDQTLSKLCSDAGLKLVEQGQHFYILDTEEGQQRQHSCREYAMPRNEKGTRKRGWILENTRIGPVLNIKVCLTPRLPQLVLKLNSHSRQQDERDQEARSSWDPPSESNAVDYRIPSILLSKVEQQDTHRQNKVKKLIEKLEKHQHKESFLQDLSQTQKINMFSKESKDLIADMNNTEIFELCENSSKKQCADCNTHWEIGIVYRSCGRHF